MYSYQPPVRRVAIGFAAVVMSALTIGVMVVLPSEIESESETGAVIATLLRGLEHPVKALHELQSSTSRKAG
jgi:hypothetical protein